MEFAIEAKGVHKFYRSGFFGRKRNHALKGIGLSIRKGEIFGLLGKNGAGKTTLLNIFSGQLIADQGSVTLLGRDITKRMPAKLKHRINMCSGTPNFPWSLTVEENLKFYSLLYGIKGRTEACIEMFNLEKYRKSRYDQLSTGNKQKLALAKSLINSPEILFLDEPTIGLDPDIARKIRDLIKAIHLRENMTIILTTHYMREAEELCERIAFINEGNIQSMGSQDEIKKLTNTRDLEEAFIELAD